MTGRGHHWTGLAAGFVVAAAWTQLGASAPEAVVAVLPAWFGGVAPDSLERICGIRWARHRTITHWVPLWICALFAVFYSDLHSLVKIAYTGFIAGGLTHLLWDWPNPLGIPFLTPWRRHSLGLWRSGEHEKKIILLMLLIAGLLWKGEFQPLMDLPERISELVMATRDWLRELEQWSKSSIPLPP